MRIGPDVPTAVVAAPSCFKECRRPKDLAYHRCINLRLPTHGVFFEWTFRKGGKNVRVSTQGRLVFASVHEVRQAFLAAVGLAHLPRDYAAWHLEGGQLVEVLSAWRKTFEGYHLYNPSRRQHPPALAALIEALRYREK